MSTRGKIMPIRKAKPFRFKSARLRAAMAAFLETEAETWLTDFSGFEYAESLLQELFKGVEKLPVSKDPEPMPVDDSGVSPGGFLRPESRPIEEIEHLAEWAADLVLRAYKADGIFVGKSHNIASLLDDYTRQDVDVRSLSVWDNVISFYKYWPETDRKGFLKGPIRGDDCRNESDARLDAVPANLVAALGFAKLDRCLTRVERGATDLSLIDLGLAWECAYVAAELNESLVDDYFAKRRATYQAQHLARIKHAKDRDGKQAAKRVIRELWEDWRNNAPQRYKSKAAFARDMSDKFLELKSTKVIETWCTLWSAEK